MIGDLEMKALNDAYIMLNILILFFGIISSDFWGYVAGGLGFMNAYGQYQLNKNKTGGN